jgi:putative membrane protein
MNPALLIIGSIFASLAAIVHVVIFYFESIGWTKPAIWKRFGLASQADADTVRPMAYNQGFYNLFLAVGAAVGVVLLATEAAQAGYAVALFATLSMVAAATVLVLSNPKLARAAVTQGALPLLAVLFYLLALI